MFGDWIPFFLTEDRSFKTVYVVEASWNRDIFMCISIYLPIYLSIYVCMYVCMCIYIYIPISAWWKKSTDVMFNTPHDWAPWIRLVHLTRGLRDFGLIRGKGSYNKKIIGHTPQNGWFIVENQSINGWFGGTPISGMYLFFGGAVSFPSHYHRYHATVCCMDKLKVIKWD